MLFCFNRLKSVLKGSVDSLQSKMKELILLLIFALVSQPVKGNWKCLENYSRTFFNTETKGWELSIRRGVRKESSFAVGWKLYKFLPSIWINWKPSDRYYCLRPLTHKWLANLPVLHCYANTRWRYALYSNWIAENVSPQATQQASVSIILSKLYLDTVAPLLTGTSKIFRYFFILQTVHVVPKNPQLIQSLPL